VQQRKLDLTGSEHEPVFRSCQYGNKPYGSVRGTELKLQSSVVNTV